MARKKGEKLGEEYKLSLREQKFVMFYMEHGNAPKAVQQAKYQCTSPNEYARKLLAKKKIQAEIARQWEEFQNERIASSQEIMGFYTMTMRGQVKDQFGLDATLADRIKAADALAKRQIDAQAIANKAKDNEVTIKLCWDRSNSAAEPNLPDVEDNDPYATSPDMCDTDEENVDGEQ